MVPLFPSASDAFGRQGFVRVINRSSEAGDVRIEALDDDGVAYGPLTLAVDADSAAHFNSVDLEDGNVGKGLTGSTGRGAGAWRLVLSSDRELGVLSYLRTSDGFVTSMHDIAAWENGAYRVAFFNPGSNRRQQSLLRVVNIGDADATISIVGTDDSGSPGADVVTAKVPAGAARTYTAAELESGGVTGLAGWLGDGAGKWQLAVDSDQPIVVLSLLSSPTGHLSNLSSRGSVGSTRSLDFRRGEQGFMAGFADYPPADEEIYELTSGYRPLPPALGPTSALYLSGVNRSDDLFMFYKGRVGGLVPGANYQVSVSAEIATDTPAGCVGVGGAPGESVWIKGGASEVEPLAVLEGSYLRMNIDVGNQSNGGEHAAVLGDMANSRSCEQPRQWQLKSLPARPIPATVAASADGRAWLLFGVDSGFESRTEVYFTRLTVTFSPAGSGGESVTVRRVNGWRP
ncbi:MAG: hypothetical protein OXU72_12680 [Gammaproteobacteria bacterium]|nr:hypothetical protein [Gammaproteobacteria bacterium]